MIMRVLRHANMKVTMETYTEVSDDRVREALDKLGDDSGDPLLYFAVVLNDRGPFR